MADDRQVGLLSPSASSGPTAPLVSRAELVNTLALYCTTGANYVVPLLVTPYLARKLGPVGFGHVTAGLALAASIGMLIDYGFPYTGTRLVAQHRESPQALAEIVSAIQTAKFFIAVVLAAVCATAWPFAQTHMVRDEQGALLLGVISGLARGMLPIYFFQGTNRLAFPAILTSVLRALGMIVAACYVRGPLDAAILVAGDAAASILNAAILTGQLHRSIHWRWPTWSAALLTIRQSWPLFVFSLLASTYTSFGIIAARSLAVPRELGLYGGADRISRAAGSVFGPIGQVVYPKLSRLVHSHPDDARLAAKWTFALNAGVGLALFLIVFAAARPLLLALLGPAYTGGVRVLSILSLQLFATALSRALGVQWMLPLGLDKLLTKLVAASVISYFAILWLLAPTLGATGMAWAFVIAEWQLVFAMAFALNRRGMGWWQACRHRQ